MSAEQRVEVPGPAGLDVEVHWELGRASCISPGITASHCCSLPCSCNPAAKHSEPVPACRGITTKIRANSAHPSEKTWQSWVCSQACCLRFPGYDHDSPATLQRAFAGNRRYLRQSKGPVSSRLPPSGQDDAQRQFLSLLASKGSP